MGSKNAATLSIQYMTERKHWIKSKKELYDYAEQMGFVVTGCSEDLGSGLDFNRTGFLEVIKAAEIGKMDVVLIKRLDRLERDALRMQELLKRLDQMGIRLHSPMEGELCYNNLFYGIEPIPNMSILAPCDYRELEQMLRYAVMEYDGPVAIRYPKGKGKAILSDVKDSVTWHKGIRICMGADITIATAGNMVETSLQVASILKNRGIFVDLINVRFLKPLDEELIIGSAMKTKKVVTIEDHSIIGGLGSNVSKLLNRYGFKIELKMFGFPDQFIGQDTRSDLFSIYKLDTDLLTHEILNYCEKTDRSFNN